MQRRHLILLAGLLLAPLGLKADSPATSTSAWLDQGAGARAQGMGNAFIAVADDASAGYWNPAGLTRMGVHATEFAAMQQWDAEDQEYDYLGLAQHWEGLADLYLGLQRSAVFGIRSYDEAGARGDDLSQQGLACTLAVAARPEYRFRWGLALRGLREDLAGSRAYGWGADLGFLFMPELASDFLLAATLKDLDSGEAWDTGRQDMRAPRLGVGISDRFIRHSWLVTLETEMSFGPDPAATLRLGTEYAVDEHWSLRAGADSLEPSAGASFNWGFYEFDYAFTWKPQSDTAYVNKASLLLKF
jgi:hypothetical protein